VLGHVEEQEGDALPHQLRRRLGVHPRHASPAASHAKRARRGGLGWGLRSTSDRGPEVTPHAELRHGRSCSPWGGEEPELSRRRRRCRLLCLCSCFFWGFPTYVAGQQSQLYHGRQVWRFGAHGH
jgi:hypothetical protein